MRLHGLFKLGYAELSTSDCNLQLLNLVKGIVHSDLIGFDPVFEAAGVRRDHVKFIVELVEPVAVLHLVEEIAHGVDQSLHPGVLFLEICNLFLEDKELSAPERFFILNRSFRLGTRCAAR